jgi:caffeoyl-CoA O-methyltransferase
MHFLTEPIDNYIVAHSQKEPELLAKLTRETYQKVLQPRMLSGHYQGRVLSLLSKLIKPKAILEVGTYTGYSALCLAEGLTIDGVLHTIDINEELYDFQKKYFEQSDYQHQICQHLGDAIDVIPKLDTQFDLVFLDADKERYIDYFHLLADRINPGGVILSDNVLWSGKVVMPLKKNDLATQVLLKYNALINEDTRFETVILPIRDGLTISRKK